jgi:hypothetical protein
MHKDIDSTVYMVYGFINDVKIKPGNWSVKVVSYPQPAAYDNAEQPYRYGGQGQPSEDNEDGYGEWITLDLAEGDLFPKRPGNSRLPAHPTYFSRFLYFITSWHHCLFLEETRRFLD